jgi:uncharacterized protein YbjT (DUF2867 family)
MADKKIIAVVGATGAQGGGLVRAILGDPEGGFVARALTRNPDSDKAKALAAAGAEVVRADLDDEASVRAAFEGAYGAFCVTNYWEHFSVDKEIAQAHTMAQAAKDAGLQHVIWSTLEDTRRFMDLDDDRMPTLNGKYKVPHFDGKGEADGVFREAGVPTTFLATCGYWENFIFFGWEPQRLPDGKLALILPLGDKKLPGIAADDIGKCALGIFKEGTRHVGETIAIAAEHLTGKELAAGLSKALGEEVVYAPLSFDDYRNLGFPGADDVGNMFQFKHDFQEAFVGVRDISVVRRLNPELQTFSEWLERNGSKIPKH